MAYEQGTYQGSGQSRSGYTPTSRTKLQTINPRPNSGGPATLKWGEIGGTKTSGGGLNLGGLFGSLGSAYAARQARKIAEENRRWQTEQNTIAYERSLPWSSFGPAGNVEFDPETKKMLQTLKPEYQAMMQGFIGSSAMAGEELQMMYSDPNKMARDQFDMLQEFSADDYAQSRMQGQEAAIARGMQGTESYYDKMAIEDSISKSILGDKISSVGLGMDYRNMLSTEYLNAATAARDTAGMLLPDAKLGVDIGRFAHTGKNMQGIREGGQDYADTQSAFYSGMLDQKAKYNQQGNVTQEAQPGWLSQLLNVGKQGYSMLTDNNRTNKPQYGYSKIV